VNRSWKWLSVLLALVLIITALPVAALAQGGPGQGNPPPGQEGNAPPGQEGNAPPGQEGNDGNNDNNGNNGNGGNDGLEQQLGEIAGQPGAQQDQVRTVNVPAKRLLGLPIVDLDGNTVGRVSDMLVSIAGQRQSGDPARPATGGLVAGARVDYALAQYGGVLGLGGRLAPIPLSALRLHLVDAPRLGLDDNMLYFDGVEPGNDALQARNEFFRGNAFILVSDQQNLDNAPKFDLDGLPGVTDHTWDRNLRAYWQGLGPMWPEAPTQNGAAYRVARVRNLSGFDLRTLGGNAIGNIDDVLLTLAVASPAAAPLPSPGVTVDGADVDGVNNAGTAGTNAHARALSAALPIVDARINYALVSHSGFYGIGGRRTPVPFSMFMMDRNYEARAMYVESDNNLLRDAPSLQANDGRDLNEPNFFNRIHAYWQQAGFGPFGL
jgi:hypothetical protein